MQICAFVFAYAKSRLSHDATLIITDEVVKRLLRDALLVGGDATTIWYQKLGGFTRAMDDFAKSNPSEVKSFARV